MKKQRQTAATASQSPQSDRIRWQPTQKHIRAQQPSVSWSRLLFFACSGYGLGQSWNNRGSNGYYWSRSLYSQTYGRNLHFYSGGVNPQNDNYRFNGFTRRAVQHSSLHRLTPVTGTVLHGTNRMMKAAFIFYHYNVRHHHSDHSPDGLPADTRATALRPLCGLLRRGPPQAQDVIRAEVRAQSVGESE